MKTTRKRVISPSMLSADFANLERDVKMIEQSQAEWLHIDVMDGVFVPNISMGFPILEAIRRVSKKIMDVHLMIVDPERYIERFVRSGADIVTVHIEATHNIHKCIDMIHELGAKVGISIKPGTPISNIIEFIPMIDLVLVMSVEPGFGGQSFIESCIDKVAELNKAIEDQNADCVIEVDGGVSTANVARLYDAGASVVVSGSAIFKSTNPELEIYKLLNA